MSVGPWESIRCGLYEWLLECSDSRFDDCNISFFDQALPVSEYPFIKIGIDSINSDNPSKTYNTDMTRAEGEEIEVTTSYLKYFTVRIECSTDESSGSSTHSCNSLSTLDSISDSMRTFKAKSIFCKYGLSAIELLDITDISLFLNSKAISRASMDIRFSSFSSCSEFIGYIGSVRLSPQRCDPGQPNKEIVIEEP